MVRFLLESKFGTEYNIFGKMKFERRGSRMAMKVIAYDVGTTGLKACLFEVSAENGITYVASTVED